MKVIVLKDGSLIMVEKCVRFYFSDWQYVYTDIEGGARQRLCSCSEKESRSILQGICDFIVSDTAKVLEIEKIISR